jgi:ankyrin repeat protein
MKAMLCWAAELLVIAVIVAVVWSDPAPVSDWFEVVSPDEQLLPSSWAGDDEQFDDALRRGASIGARDSSGATPLHYAASSGHVDLVRRLIARGAEVDAANEGGVTPLGNAAINDHADVLESLLAEGARPTEDVLNAVFAMAERTEPALRRWRATLAEGGER